MRYIRYLFLLVVGAALLILALANRSMVTLKVLPDELAAYLDQPFSFEIPLFIAIFGGIAIGLLIGFVWEYFREHKHRVDARVQKREKEKLAREMRGLKARQSEGQDEVLALLDDAATR